MTSYERTVGHLVYEIGARFMMRPETGRWGEDLGLDFLSFYFLGRGGVLGTADGATAARAFYFFEPELVAQTWEAASEKVPPPRAASRYAEACAAWGREQFAHVGRLEEFSELVMRVVAAARPTPSADLFRGWKAAPLPHDPPGRAAVLVTFHLRELRGGAHVDATKEVGLSPLEAVAVNSPNMARIFGWRGELPDPEPLRERAERAEDLTDEFVRPAFAVLDEGEQELVRSVVEAASA